MDNFMIAALIFLASIFAARTINDKANKKLEKDKKLELMDLFSKNRTRSFLILILLIAVFFLSIKFELINLLASYTIYVVSISIFMAYSAYGSYQKLKAHDFPTFYINAYLLSTSIRFIGIVIFFGLIASR